MNAWNKGCGVWVGAAIVCAIALCVLLLLLFYPWRKSEKRQSSAEQDAALSESLRRAAEAALPDPRIAPEPIVVRCEAAQVESRIENAIRLAETLGGSAVESVVSEADDRRLLVELPASRIELYRRALAGDGAPGAPGTPRASAAPDRDPGPGAVPSPNAGASPGAGPGAAGRERKDYLEVRITPGPASEVR